MNATPKLDNPLEGGSSPVPCSPSSGVWYNIHEKQPEEGQVVSLWFSHRQIRQAVRASEYGGGFKMPNCAGWECVGHHWGWMWSPEYVPEPTPEERKWRDPIPENTVRSPLDTAAERNIIPIRRPA